MTLWNVFIISLAQINLIQCHKETLFCNSKGFFMQVVGSYCNILEVSVFLKKFLDCSVEHFRALIFGFNLKLCYFRCSLLPTNNCVT